MAFAQDPPQLSHPFRTDRVLRQYLARRAGGEALAEIEASLDRMGELAGGELWRLTLEGRRDEPELIQWDPWGRRIDEIRVPEAWRRYAEVAATEGVVATGYERRHGALSRIHQFALVYLFDPSSSVYTCPLAMTDGAAKTLTLHAEPALRDRILARLLDRNPATAWTSGQWMTEKTGGSDVGLSEAVARKTAEGWRLWGDKWFTSATTSQVALTLARPEGNGPGGKGLAMFLVELRAPDGGYNGIRVNRLKDKLGTRMLPTAELTLEGTLATPVGELKHGVRRITPMLNITRLWNSVCAAAKMRRGLSLARDYAARRVAFGAKLADKPLHLETLAGLQAEFEGAFHLAFRCAELLGREETGEATAEESTMMRLLTPLMKLTTGKQTVAVTSEILEAFGGAGYVEDTGLPMLLRDAQVLPIWEGTTNVLALDALRAIAREGALAPLLEDLRARAGRAKHPQLKDPAEAVLAAIARVEEWFEAAQSMDLTVVEAGARRFALTLGRTTELALLVDEAQWAIDTAGDGRAAAAARRFARHGVDLLIAPGRDEGDARALALDEPLPA